MLQFTDSAGYTWYINHLISFIVLSVSFTWACRENLLGRHDKFLHYSVSFGITLLLIWFLPYFHIAWWWSPIAAFGVGVAKEIYDFFHPKTHTCDIKDLMADCIGIIAMTSLYFFSWVMYKG